MTKQQMLDRFKRNGHKVVFSLKSDYVYVEKNGVSHRFTSVTAAYKKIFTRNKL